jgi:hypothetical protein
MPASTDKTGVEGATIRAITWRILPLLMVCYFIAFVDRVNAGFAALQMNQDIGLSAAAFGLGGGLFYITLRDLRRSATSSSGRSARESGSRKSGLRLTT